MDIIIKEIEYDDEDIIKEFDEVAEKITNFLQFRYYHLDSNAKKKERTNINIKLSTNTTIQMDLVKLTYIKLFNKPIDGNYDTKKIEIIKKHLKLKNLI
jgi:hypothetical protein